VGLVGSYYKKYVVNVMSLSLSLWKDLSYHLDRKLGGLHSQSRHSRRTGKSVLLSPTIDLQIAYQSAYNPVITGILSEPSEFLLVQTNNVILNNLCKIIIEKDY